MNTLERKMVEVLKDLRDNHHVVGIKAEFEAEGTRLEEALRLKEVISRAGLGLTLKVGGCEALRDIYEARTIGVERIVAPMVETPFALQKFLRAVDLAFPADEQEDVQFAVNIETLTAYRAFEAMLAVPEARKLGCIVVGRVDLTGSMGLGRGDVNSRQIFDITADLVARTRAAGLEICVGGGVSAETLPWLRELPLGGVHRFETRKVIFGCPAALAADGGAGILKAVGFELLWLKNKRDYYGLIFEEDHHRIDMLERRYREMIELAGGIYG
jgi:hypothetical protein